MGALAKARKRPPPGALDDASLSKKARFTDRFALADYGPFLWYVPRIVNVVRASAPALARPPQLTASPPGR